MRGISMTGHEKKTIICTVAAFLIMFALIILEVNL